MENNRYMLPVGTKICNGLYVVKEQLSSGGFGNTYKVEELFHGEIFAMKEFFIKGINDRTGRTVIVSNDENIATFQKQREKFKVEAERLRDLTNEHIVKVHSFFEENETSYYIMDFIDGKSMDQRKSPLKEDDAMDVLRQVLDALSAVHQVKSVEEGKERIWVHLDIKPANLMIDKNGKVTLIDFGASKQLSADNRNSSISLSQMPFTKPYAPLEQISQQVDSIGPWTDFYALGATLYALQTEKDTEIPEYSKLQDLINGKADLEKAFAFPKKMSEKMRKFIVWMMNPIRDNRPQSVSEIWSHLKLNTGDDVTELGHVLTIKTEPAEGGEVNVKPQKKQYENGEKVSCEAKAQKGYRFQGWYNSEGALVGAKTDYSFSITGNTELKAKFKAEKEFKVCKKLFWIAISAITFIAIVCTSIYYTFFNYKIGIWYKCSEGYIKIYKSVDGQEPRTMGDKVTWGFMNKKGDIITPLIYEEPDDFHEGFARVKKEEGGRYGYINQKGNVAIDFLFNDADGFSEGLACVQKEKGGNYGYINPKGEIAIDFIYKYAGSFSEGLACVKNENGYYGYINRHGDVIIDFTYKGASSFSEGLACVKNDNGWGFIDRKGVNIIPFVHSNRGRFSDGFAQMSMYKNVNGEWGTYYGFIDKKGNVAIDYDYFMADDFHDGVARVLKEKEGNWNYIDKSNKYILPLNHVLYESNRMSEGLLNIRKKENHKIYTGYINKEGKQVIPFFEGEGTYFSDGLAGFIKDNKVKYINTNGDIVFEFEYNKDKEFVYLGNFHEGVASLNYFTRPFFDSKHHHDILIDINGNIIFDTDNIWDMTKLKIKNLLLK